MDWSDVVVLDNLGVEGLALEQALFKFANLNELHDYVDGKCVCPICQVLIPMARKLEREITVELGNLAEIVDEWGDIPLVADLPMYTTVSRAVLDFLVQLDARQDEWFTRLRQAVGRLAAYASDKDSAEADCVKP